MDISNIMKNGAQAFQSKLDADGDGKIEVSDLVPALTDLFTNAKGDMDISSILSGMNAGGLTSLAQSWLGEGENESIEGEQVTHVLGLGTIATFADKLGVKVEQAVTGLQEAMPQIIDQASSGAESLMDIAGDLFEGDTTSAKALLGDTATRVSAAAAAFTAPVGDAAQDDSKTA